MRLLGGEARFVHAFPTATTPAASFGGIFRFSLDSIFRIRYPT